MDKDKTLISMKSSDSGKTVEETKQVNLKINCSEAMLNKMAEASSYPRLITISYIDNDKQIQNWYELIEFPSADINLAIDNLRENLNKNIVEPTSRRPKIIPPPRKRR